MKKQPSSPRTSNTIEGQGLGHVCKEHHLNWRTSCNVQHGSAFVLEINCGAVGMRKREDPAHPGENENRIFQIEHDPHEQKCVEPITNVVQHTNQDVVELDGGGLINIISDCTCSCDDLKLFDFKFKLDFECVRKWKKYTLTIFPTSKIKNYKSNNYNISLSTITRTCKNKYFH